MQPYIKAMAWAFWRERRTHFVLFILIAITFSITIRQFFPIFEKYGSPQVMIVFGVFIELFSMTMLFMAGLGSSVMHLKIPDQLYVKPVSSRFLVAIYLGLSILSVIIIHLIAVLLYRFVGNLDWPFIIPLICLISIILCAFALFWSFSDVPFICVTVTTIICGFMFIFFMEFVIKRQVPLQYFLLNIMPYLLIIDILALVISSQAIKHARYGEKLRSADYWERLYLRLKNLLPGKNWKLNTPQKAYFWLLFRNSGLILPDMNLLFVLIAILVFVFAPESDKNQTIKEYMIAFAFINLFMFPFFGALMAHQEDKTFGVSYQIATRPISERSILLTLLKVFAISYIIGWIIYFVGLAIILTLLSATGHLDFSDISISEIQQKIFLFSFPTILLYLLGIWAATGLVGSILLSGKKWLVLSFFSTLFILPIILMLINTFTSETINRILKSLFIWSLAFGSFSGTILAMRYAIRRHLISSRFVRYLAGVYVSFCIIGLLLNFSIMKIPVNAVIFCGMLSLAFAPLATAPLALHWNRHR